MPLLETSTRRCVNVVVLLVFALGACSSPARVQQAPAPTRIYDVRAKHFIGEPALVADLAGARYRLLGEIHDDPLHHTIRARLLHEIARRGLRPAVVMEQFDLDHDGALRAAQNAGEDAEQAASAGELDRKGWQWPLHEPIVAAALALHLPLRAGNLSRTALSGDLDAAQREHPRMETRLRAARWTDAQASELRSDIVESHCNMLPDAIVPKLVLGQRMRDAAMAQALVDDATADGAVLIAGNGHVRDDLGVPVYLRAPGLGGADSRSISVGFIEVNAGDERDAEFPQRLIAANPGFDVVFLTPAIARPDPCEAFRRGSKR
ncbi:MAG TPA: ChaN family lipoprotein [Casimicrobiaceae bacterium]